MTYRRRRSAFERWLDEILDDVETAAFVDRDWDYFTLAYEAKLSVSTVRRILSREARRPEASWIMSIFKLCVAVDMDLTLVRPPPVKKKRAS